MTEQQHPIIPPPELVEQWVAEIWHEGTPVRVAASDLHIATQAARWGADQELQECCHLLRLQGFDVIDDLRTARRPKPPTLKEQALEAFQFISKCHPIGGPDWDTIRRALEQLDG